MSVFIVNVGAHRRLIGLRCAPMNACGGGCSNGDVIENGKIKTCPVCGGKG